jgi:hypothetical protein
VQGESFFLHKTITRLLVKCVPGKGYAVITQTRVLIKATLLLQTDAMFFSFEMTIILLHRKHIAFLCEATSCFVDGNQIVVFIHKRPFFSLHPKTIRSSYRKARFTHVSKGHAPDPTSKQCWLLRDSWHGLIHKPLHPSRNRAINRSS